MVQPDRGMHTAGVTYSPEGRRERMLLQHGGRAWIAAVCTGVLWGALQAWDLMAVMVASAIIQAAASQRFTAAQHHRRLVDVLAGSTWIGVFFATLRTGGWSSPLLVWTFAPTVIALALGGRVAGRNWTVFCLAGLAGVAGMTLWGTPWPNALPEGWTPTVGMASGVVWGAVVVSTMFQLVAERDLGEEHLHRATKQALRAQRDAEGAHEAARAVLDNVDQGLLIVRPDGSVLEERSALCDELFGVPSDEDTLWSLVAPMAPELALRIELAWEEMTMGFMPRHITVGQLPETARLVGARGHVLEVALAWRDIDQEGNVLVVVTNITDALQAERERTAQHETLSLLMRWFEDRPSVETFVAEGRRLVEAVLSGDASAREEARHLHTLKGNAGMMGLHGLATELHHIEEAMARRGGGMERAEREQLRSRYDHLSTLLAPLLTRDRGALRVSRSDFRTAVRRLRRGDDPHAVVGAMERWRWMSVAGALQTLATQADALGKRLNVRGLQVDVVCEGDVRMPDTRAWRALSASLVHVVRNALDHGLREVPAGRVPTLTLRGQESDGQLTLVVQDNGVGIAWDKLTAKARELGLEGSDREAALRALFEDGVSCRESVTELSGRGVGMAAVREAVVALGGDVQVQSVSGEGTCFVLSAPLSARTSCAEAVVA